MKWFRRKGFILPITIVLLASLFSVAVLSLSASRITRRTSDVFLMQYKAESASESALQHIEALFREIADNDAYTVFKQTVEDSSYLMAAKPVEEEGKWSYRYYSLFSSDQEHEDTAFLEKVELAEMSDDAVTLKPELWQKELTVEWLYIKDARGRHVARYAFWIDDEQAYLDLKKAGNANDNQRHQRVAYPELVPGSPATGEMLALYALDPDAGVDDQSRFGLEDSIYQARPGIVGMGDLLGASFKKAKHDRDDQGGLLDSVLRATEENGVYDLMGYEELPTIPLVEGVAPDVVSTPKKNLNDLIKKETAVDDISSWMDVALPLFAVQRKGGFPENYAKTLAASIVDYADVDGDTTALANEYRGIDAFPVVTEYLMHFQWLIDGPEKYTPDDGRLRVRVFAELWNHSNQPLSGKLQANFETHYSLYKKGEPNLAHLSSEEVLGNPEKSSHTLVKKTDGYYFPELSFGEGGASSLESGEYRLVELGSVDFMLDSSRIGGKRVRFFDLKGDSFQSRYRILWNNVLVDQSRGGLTRNNMKLRSSPAKRAQGRLNVAALRHGRWGEYTDNGGDARMSYFLTNRQWGPAYPDNFSPHRRNVLLNLFEEDKPYTRSFLSEWPDGGHSADFGNSAYLTTDKSVDPLDFRFSQGKPAPESLSAPTVLSNRGYYKSVTELGHIFDPVMWDVNSGERTGGGLWEIHKDAKPDSRYGGGNTLRIGRPEHPLFDRKGVRSCNLLDIFHAVQVDGEARPTLRREAAININTATHDTLRVLFAGTLKQDPLIGIKEGLDPKKIRLKARLTELSAPGTLKQADTIAEAIIRARPFAAVSQLSHLTDEKGEFIFGNANQHIDDGVLQWSDRAREELFARGYDNSTVRSRNFRLHVIGQSIARNRNGSVKVLAEDRRSLRAFLDPGLRDDSGAIIPSNLRLLRRELRLK